MERKKHRVTNTNRWKFQRWIENDRSKSKCQRFKKKKKLLPTSSKAGFGECANEKTEK